MKSSKSPGPDEISSATLQLIKEMRVDTLLKLLNARYKTGIIPHKMLKLIFICLPKKHNAKECNDHRVISLMSHTLNCRLQ